MSSKNALLDLRVPLFADGLSLAGIVISSRVAKFLSVPNERAAVYHPSVL